MGMSAEIDGLGDDQETSSVSCVANGSKDIPPDPPHQPASDRRAAKSESSCGFVIPVSNISDFVGRVREAKAAIAEFHDALRPRDDSHRPRPEHRQHQAPDPGGMEEEVIPTRQYAILVQRQARIADADDDQRIGHGIPRRDRQPPKADADRRRKIDQGARPVVQGGSNLATSFSGATSKSTWNRTGLRSSVRKLAWYAQVMSILAARWSEDERTRSKASTNRSTGANSRRPRLGARERQHPHRASVKDHVGVVSAIALICHSFPELHGGNPKASCNRLSPSHGSTMSILTRGARERQTRLPLEFLRPNSRFAGGTSSSPSHRGETTVLAARSTAELHWSRECGSWISVFGEPGQSANY